MADIPAPTPADIKDQEDCNKEIAASLKKYDCILQGRAVIVSGACDVQVFVLKNKAPDVSKAAA